MQNTTQNQTAQQNTATTGFFDLHTSTKGTRGYGFINRIRKVTNGGYAVTIAANRGEYDVAKGVKPETTYFNALVTSPQAIAMVEFLLRQQLAHESSQENSQKTDFVVTGSFMLQGVHVHAYSRKQDLKNDKGDVVAKVGDTDFCLNANLVYLNNLRINGKPAELDEDAKVSASELSFNTVEPEVDFAYIDRIRTSGKRDENLSATLTLRMKQPLGSNNSNVYVKYDVNVVGKAAKATILEIKNELDRSLATYKASLESFMKGGSVGKKPSEPFFNVSAALFTIGDSSMHKFTHARDYPNSNVKKGDPGAVIKGRLLKLENIVINGQPLVLNNDNAGDEYQSTGTDDAAPNALNNQSYPKMDDDTPF